ALGALFLALGAHQERQPLPVLVEQAVRDVGADVAGRSRQKDRHSNTSGTLSSRAAARACASTARAPRPRLLPFASPFAGAVLSGRLGSAALSLGAVATTLSSRRTGTLGTYSSTFLLSITGN